MRFRALLALLGMVTATFAPLASAQSEDLQLTDPTGDAYDATPEQAATNAQGYCHAVGAPTEACAATPLPPPTPGAPASAGRDLVGLRMRETPEHLVVEILVARLDAGLSEVTPRDQQMADFGACWNGGLECVVVFVTRVSDRHSLLALVTRYDPDACGDGGACLWWLPVEFRPGSPGAITVRVPRAMLFDGEAGAALADPTVYSSVGDAAGLFATWTLANSARGSGGVLYGPSSASDVAGPGRPFTFATRSASTWDAVAERTRLDEDGDAHNADALPDVDILSTTFLENETRLGLSFEIARVAAHPPDSVLFSNFALGSGANVQAHVETFQGKRTVDSGICGDANCTYRLQLRPVLDIVEGEPGWINVTYDRRDLGHPRAGTLVTNAAGWIDETLANGTRSVSSELSPPPAAGEASFTLTRNSDWYVGGPAYVLRLDGVRPAAAAAAPGVALRDPAGDTAQRAEIDSAAGQYDIVVASIEGASPTSSRFTLGVRDLSRVTVPAGWKAVVYAMGVETDRGLFMVGYYREQGRPEFFCAPDTLVLTEELRDPQEVIWRTIEGTLSIAGGAARGGSGSSSASTITFTVPHECFDVDEPGPVEGRSLAAGIYLVPQNPDGLPVAAVWQADDARNDTLGAFTLGTPIPVAEQPAWYAQPFGIENFWDITGILFAVLLAIAGFVAVRRKRNALQRYMEQIDRALSAHAGETKSLEVALVGIRRRLKDDIVRGRIAEAHYLLVEARLNEHLKNARIYELTEAFGDLPHRLLQKLLEILADGSITRDEARRFRAMLEDSGFTAEAKARIERKLDLWVVDDAPA